MIIFGRPLSVLISLLPFGKSHSMHAYFGRIKRSCSIVFAMYPWIAGLENAKLIFNIVFYRHHIFNRTRNKRASMAKVFEFSIAQKCLNPLILDTDF